MENENENPLVEGGQGRNGKQLSADAISIGCAVLLATALMIVAAVTL